MKNKITPEQEKIIDTIHNLIWHRITHDDKYLEDIPEIDSPEFHEWIYYIKYEFLEYDDSQIQGIVYLNGKHYQYIQTPQFLNSVWVNEIDDSEVEKKIIELHGETYEGFAIYDPHTPLDESERKKLDEFSGREYFDLPF